MPTSVNTPQPSFIPRDAKQPTNRYGGAGFNELMLLLAIVAIVASAALAGGVFLYGQYLDSSNANKLSQLQRAEAAFEPSLVQQLQRLDDRMNVTGQLLQQHIAPIALFSMLEQTTISSIQFTSLQFDATDLSHISLKMTGVADSVNAVALQSDLFSKSGAIQSPIFSDLSRAKDGVHFNFSSYVNPNALSYAGIVSGQTSVNQLPSSTSTMPASNGAIASSTQTQPSNVPNVPNAPSNPNPFNPSSQGAQTQGAPALPPPTN